jgi:hypothetical protein
MPVHGPARSSRRRAACTAKATSWSRTFCSGVTCTPTSRRAAAARSIRSRNQTGISSARRMASIGSAPASTSEPGGQRPGAALLGHALEAAPCPAHRPQPFPPPLGEHLDQGAGSLTQRRGRSSRCWWLQWMHRAPSSVGGLLRDAVVGEHLRESDLHELVPPSHRGSRGDLVAGWTAWPRPEVEVCGKAVPGTEPEK